MQYKNVTIIGTSHIARQSLQEVRKAIEEQMPNLIALELDKQRYVALQNRKSSDKIPLYAIKRVGFKGFVFALIASWASKKLGQHVGVMPGSEMLQAMKLAQKHKIPVALIDQNIEVTLRNSSQSGHVRVGPMKISLKSEFFSVGIVSPVGRWRPYYG